MRDGSCPPLTVPVRSCPLAARGTDTVKLPTFRFFSTETFASASAWPLAVVLIRRTV
jgi:hypothetical protein